MSGFGSTPNIYNCLCFKIAKNSNPYSNVCFLKICFKTFVLRSMNTQHLVKLHNTLFSRQVLNKQVPPYILDTYILEKLSYTIDTRGFLPDF